MNDADDQGPRVGFYQYRVVVGQVLKKNVGYWASTGYPVGPGYDGARKKQQH